MTRHFPPGGGGGVQRPLKFATHLPALGIETHVLAPDIAGAVAGRGARAADAGVDPPRALRRAARGPSLGGARRQAGRRTARHAGRAVRSAPARPGRERALEHARAAGGDPARPARGDRRRAHDLAAAVAPPARRRGEADDRRRVGRRPPRPTHLASASTRLRVAARAPEGEDHRRGGEARRLAGGRDRRGVRRDRRGDARAGAEGQGRHDRERLRLRRLCGTGIPLEREAADHARGPLPRQARPEAVPARTRGVRPRRRRRPLRRRLPRRRPRVRGIARPRRPHRAARRRLAPPLARAATGLRGAAPPDPGVRRPRPWRPDREDLRVPRGRAADPRRRPARRRGREARARHGSRRRGSIRRRGRACGRRCSTSTGAGRRGASTGRRSRTSGATRLSRGGRVEELADLLRSLA